MDSNHRPPACEAVSTKAKNFTLVKIRANQHKLIYYVHIFVRFYINTHTGLLTILLTVFKASQQHFLSHQYFGVHIH